MPSAITSDEPRSGHAASWRPARFVSCLPDLISAAEYAGDPEGGTVRLRITVSGEGVELLGDAMRPPQLDAILEALGADVIEEMLCG